MRFIIECDVGRRLFVLRWNQTLDIFSLFTGLTFGAQKEGLIVLVSK